MRAHLLKGGFLILDDFEGEAQWDNMARQMARMKQNVAFFLAHYMLPITGYAPDVETLRAASPRIVVGIGEDSGGQLAHDTALALATRLGTEPVTFPGDHAGYVGRPEAFAQKLDAVFRGN
jgi:hypothetical protein